jgi:hypothetical protein
MVSTMRPPNETATSAPSSRRLRRENKTVAIMVQMHCRDRHEGMGLCPDCAALLEYALRRVEGCPFGDKKPTCARCPVHCYRPEMREQIRAAMRYAGPRMTWRHPYLAAMHLLDRRRMPREEQPHRPR